jgi:hypothetical protein
MIVVCSQLTNTGRSIRLQPVVAGASNDVDGNKATAKRRNVSCNAVSRI